MAREIAFTSWSASRLDDYTLCPMFAKLKHLDKLCMSCFKGRLMGKFGEIAKCNACGKERITPPAMARGGVIGKSLEQFVKGETKKLHEEIEHPQIIAKAKDLRVKFRKKRVTVEQQVSFDRNFAIIPPERGWTPDIWLITKLDVYEDGGDDSALVIDWKTGGVDKAGFIRAQAKYDDQLLSYQVAVLCRYPKIQTVDASLAFVDCRDEQDPFIARDPLLRKDLRKAQDKLRKLSLPIMSDRVFAPRPNDRCTYCDYGKRKNGPCQY